MKKVITYGTYDLLHRGHIRLLERAKALGDYLIVGITSDSFDKERGKLNVKQSLAERFSAVAATNLADQIIVEEYEGQKVSDIIKYGVDVFTVGSDWVGKFDYLKSYCEVVYLERTTGISSTELRNKENSEILLGIIGLEIPVERMIDEVKFVSGVSICGVFSSDCVELEGFCAKNNLMAFSSLDAILSKVDAVYIAVSREKNEEYICAAIEHDCHVLCESPIFLSVSEMRNILKLAQKKRLVIMEALKTRFFPAFERLSLLVRSGIIGEVKDIDVSCSQMPSNLDWSQEYLGSIYDFGSYVLLPISRFLGTEAKKINLYGDFIEKYCRFVKGEMLLRFGTATFKIGKGIKTEGNLIITGTKGYIYVPAPWWKTDYFEVRYEDLRNTKKYFYKFEGEGLRYELNEFVKRINGCCYEMAKEEKQELIQSTSVVEKFRNSKVYRI